MCACLFLQEVPTIEWIIAFKIFFKKGRKTAKLAVITSLSLRHTNPEVILSSN